MPSFGIKSRLQFGHACLRVETIQMDTYRFELKQLQFGHACLRVETWYVSNCHGSSGCFNSATPACAWRLGSFAVTVKPGISFNSATPACAWRRGNGFSVGWLLGPLQFGHACLRVETSVNSQSLLIAASALQFGHACLRVETVQNFGGRALPLALQFGHACLRVET